MADDFEIISIQAKKNQINQIKKIAESYGIEIVASGRKHFEGIPDITSLFVSLSLGSLPLILKFIISLKKVSRNNKIKYKDIELTGIPEKQLPPIIKKLLIEMEKNEYK